MRDPIRVLWRCAIAASSMLLFNACADEADAPEVGVAVVKLENVPEGVSCVRVRAVGVTSSEQRADVATGDTVELLMEGLPLGATDFYGSAFDIPCKEVTGGSSAAWVGGPEMAVVTPAAIVEVKLVLRPNGKSLVQVQFETGATGEPCVGPEAGCLDPADAVGSADDPAPDGAIMVSPSEFADGLNNGGNILASPRIDAAQKTAEQQEDDLNLGLVKDLLANDPEALDRLLRAPVEDDRLQLMPDGNYRLVLADPGPDGAPQEVITMGSRFALAEAAAGLTEFGTYDNQLTIYQQLHQLLPKEYMATANLPLPDEVAKLSAGEILRINRGIEADIGVILGYIQLPDLPPVGYPQSCADEEGTPPGGPYLDQTNGGCKPAHIFDLHRFPLKWRATCVKNQRNRGTCVAFGITAAVETKIAVNHNRWTNLSEQRLYYWAKAPTKHGDGLNTSGVMDSMVSSAFTYPWEHNWDYNPSPSRDSVGDPAYYVNSCVGYSAEHCSDTSHQGDKVCSSFLGLMFCSTDGSAVPASGFQMKNRLHLWSYGAVGGSALGRLFLALSHPLVISLPVTPTFDQAAGNGIMTYAGAGEDNRGGHALAVMGFVDNENLPGGYPAGAGGGYFIVKNSWGQCWKDGGYVYIPYDWVHTYGYALTAVSQVN